MKGIKSILLVAALLFAVAEQQSKAEAFAVELSQMEVQLSPPEAPLVPVVEESPVLPTLTFLSMENNQWSQPAEIQSMPPKAPDPWSKIPSYPPIECKEREAFLRESIRPPLPIMTRTTPNYNTYHGIHTRK